MPFGALTAQEQTYLNTLYAQRQPLINKSMRMDGSLTNEEEQRLNQIDAEINRLEKQKQTIIGKMRPYMRILAMGIEYQRSKSIWKALGASIVPYPYIVYVAYDAYVKKPKRKNPRRKKARRK